MIWNKLNIIETFSDNEFSLLFREEFVVEADFVQEELNYKFNSDVQKRINQLMKLYLNPDEHFSVEQMVAGRLLTFYAFHYSAALNNIWNRDRSGKYFLFISRERIYNPEFKWYQYETLGACILEVMRNDGKRTRILMYSFCPLEPIKDFDDDVKDSNSLDINMYSTHILMTLCASCDIHIVTSNMVTRLIDLWAKSEMATFKQKFRFRHDIPIESMFTNITLDLDIWAGMRKLVFDPTDGYARSDKKRKDDKLKPESQRADGNTLAETLMWELILGPKKSKYELQAIQLKTTLLGNEELRTDENVPSTNTKIDNDVIFGKINATGLKFQVMKTSGK